MTIRLTDRYASPLVDPIFIGADLPPPAFGMTSLLREICYRLGLSVQDVKSTSRAADLCDARFEFYYRARRLMPTPSYQMIGRFIGGRNHATVIKGEAQHMEKNGLVS